MKNLLLEIAKCGEIEKAKVDTCHACNKIVTSQSGDFQLPEPWNGHLDTAEILFISSNPSIDPKENYPTASWKDEDIISFFENRFENTPKNEWSKYWRTILKWAGWIIPDVGFDKIAVTEIVHCKSAREFGVTPYCQKTCFNKWLREILKIFKGKYIVVVGKKAEEYIKYHLDEEFTDGKKVIFAPAPMAHVKGLTNEKRKQDILNQLK
ncbi:MAG: hypothetical protein HFE40_03970 [Clostridia bacterium]|nr:hypothetical protein [Clostridia bacterium]